MSMKSDRKEIAKSIMEDPESYKVCEVCGAIVAKEVSLCHHCGAYRFNESAEEVSDRALSLAAAPRRVLSYFDAVTE